MKLVKRAAFALLLLSFIGTARCYHTDFAAAVGGMPFVGPMVIPPDPTPEYVAAIGTPAPLSTLAEPNVETWWPENPEENPSTLRHAREWLVAGQNPAGWTQLCAAAGDAVGAERDLAAPNRSALGCSNDPSVTRLQQFAILVLRLDPELQRYLGGAPGSSHAEFEATLAQVRVECGAGYASRVIGTEPVAAACALPDVWALGTDATALLESVRAAYGGLATEIATLDPTIDDVPSFFEPDGDN